MVKVGDIHVTTFATPASADGLSMGLMTSGTMLAERTVIYQWYFDDGVFRMLVVVNGERVL